MVQHFNPDRLLSFLRSARLLIPASFVALSLFQHCGPSMLLTDESLSSIGASDGGETRLEFYDKSFAVPQEGPRFVRTHWLLHVGADREVSPTIIATVDAGVVKLVNYEARILHPDGSIFTYGIKDLHTIRLSTSSAITTASLRAPSIGTSLEPGDLVELATMHEISLPELGMTFGVDEVPYPADRVTCRVDFQPGIPLQFVITDSVDAPEVRGRWQDGSYAFVWQDYAPATGPSTIARARPAGDVLIADPLLRNIASGGPATWKDFGNWYLGVIQDRLEATPKIAQLAASITQDAKTDREKMDAIFDYCQTTIRYSQIYLENGEFIPNVAETILERKYGDCKDYSLLMYVLAKSIGLDADLALCHRGRALAFEQEIPVSQFNHMILHYEDGDSCLWYDGTNRVGLAGMTSMDLVNTTALVLRLDGSHLERIPEAPSNNLRIGGSLSPRNQEFRGRLDITLADQYAIDFFWSAFHMNAGEMKEMLVAWLRAALAERVVVDSLAWRLEDQAFVMSLDCRLPNSVLPVGPVAYVTLDGVFGQLLSRGSDPGADARWDYYPHYSNVSIDLELPGLWSPPEGSSKPRIPAAIHASYAFPGGPFTEQERQVFEERYQRARKVWSEQRTFSLKE